MENVLFPALRLSWAATAAVQAQIDSSSARIGRLIASSRPGCAARNASVTNRVLARYASSIAPVLNGRSTLTVLSKPQLSKNTKHRTLRSVYSRTLSFLKGDARNLGTRVKWRRHFQEYGSRFVSQRFRGL